MTNLTTKLKTGIAIAALIAGTIIGAAGAQAIDFKATIGEYDFSDPWSGGLTGKTYAEQADIFALDQEWIFATKDIVDQAMLNAGIATYDQFMLALGYDSNGLLTVGPGCTTNTCNLRFDTVGIPNAHFGLAENPSIFGLANFIPDTSTGTSLNDNNTLGALGYRAQPAPSPEITGLMLGGLGLMGFAALRRK